MMDSFSFVIYSEFEATVFWGGGSIRTSNVKYERSCTLRGAKQGIWRHNAAASGRLVVEEWSNDYLGEISMARSLGFHHLSFITSLDCPFTACILNGAFVCSRLLYSSYCTMTRSSFNPLRFSTSRLFNAFHSFLMNI